MDETTEIGPIDYLLIEWKGRQPNGEVAPVVVDLVDRGLIRVLDVVFVSKDEGGEVTVLELAGLGGEVAELAVFEGASSGLLGDDDVAQAGDVLEPGTAAGSRPKTFSRRSTPPRQTLREERSCQDYCEGWRGRRSSPAPPLRSATASPAAKGNGGQPKNKRPRCRRRRPPPRWLRRPPRPARARRSIN
jgi:hypothetical protein